MFVARIPNRGSPPAILLRESYREGGKVKTRTLLNLSKWPEARIEAFRQLLKGEFDETLPLGEPSSGPGFGLPFALTQIVHRLGIARALGSTPQARLALFLVVARLAHQGSRLSAVRWAKGQAVHEIFGLEAFDEEDLYKALAWISKKQESIEDALFEEYVEKNGRPPALLLYDVSSSYFEGEHNELAAYGYNRDKKKGKKQIVLGLLAGPDGEPLAIKVFKGNTNDVKTLADQVDAVKNRWKIDQVIFVGDRGMIKRAGKEALGEAGFRYITALTKPQIRKLLKEQAIQMGLFDETLHEVEYEGKRLVLRRNEDARRREEHRRQNKLEKLDEMIAKRNEAVRGSPRKSPETGLAAIGRWCEKHKADRFVTLIQCGRMIRYEIDQARLEEVKLLDGCYAIETDVAAERLNTQAVHDRYRDLHLVERDFRELKTEELEVRPVYLRNEARTRGHVFICMLALKVVREIRRCLKARFETTDSNPDAETLDSALEELAKLNYLIYQPEGLAEVVRLPKPSARQAAILEALGVRLPARETSQEAAAT